jgi:hypothetical protein
MMGAFCVCVCGLQLRDRKGLEEQRHKQNDCPEKIFMCSKFAQSNDKEKQEKSANNFV